MINNKKSILLLINKRYLSSPAKKPTIQEIEQVLKRTQKLNNYNNLLNSVHPDSIETKFLPKDDLLAPTNTELRILSELPEEEFNRKVLIEPRMVRSSQQGVRIAHQWQITWLPTARWSNPLMGWTSTSDTMANVKLYFDNREEAIAFAERNAWNYEVKAPTTLTIVQPGTNKYSDNFLPKSTILKLKQEGSKNKIFASPGYGKSNFFMPLNYHGTNPVEQFGPKVKK
uniref:NADH dehydrogenase [ubiquinone] iron-sulfur protein 4, mitochondrial n=1 Tax=Chromulina nebulosa TaxID=96789 RepID=A0A7S0SXQ8_9STRA|mmetsp:Transcript_3513/g.3113  ORF Transcript_3513/g.3113 Transcript_3513/m.3113 type:complete len:228 (+) Transcript_3513:79-762(+)